MKKIKILGLALVAMFAFSAFTVASASALEFSLAQWLVNGALVASELPAITEGEIELRNSSNKGFIECSGEFDGTIGPNSLDLITKVLSLTLLDILELTGEPLLCKAVAESACEASATDIEVWPLNLPWLTELELDLTDETAWILIFGNINPPGYHVSCLVLGFKIEEECSAAEGAETEALNVAGGIETMGKTIPNGHCGTGTLNAEQIILPGNIELTTEAGTTLSISE